MTRSHPLVDVIVPVYNVENYLTKCVDSLLAQDFEDYCIILVDDGSTDGSGLICDDYAVRFPERVRVIRKPNGGLSDARNAGVQASAAELICFVDSDDHVSEHYLSSMHQALERYDAQMTIAPVYREFPRPDGSARLTRPPAREASLMGRDEALTELNYETFFAGYAVAKLLPRGIVLSHPFPLGRYYEDTFTVYRWFMDCEKIAYIPEASYYYYQRPGSIQRSVFDTRHLDLLDAIEESLRVFRENNMPAAVLSSGIYRMLRACYVTLFHAASDLDKVGFADIYRQVSPSLEKVYPAVIRLKRLSKKERVLYYLAHRRPRAFYAVVRTLSNV